MAQHAKAIPSDSQDVSPFRVDPGDDVPVGVQLDWRLRALIASGHLPPGERLPSVRSLAEWAGVNVNTVRAVYARLEEEGLVGTQHGAGTFVLEGRFAPELERIAANAIAEARAAGADPRQLAIVAFVCAAMEDGPEPRPETELPDPAGGDERAARVELRRQIGRLEAQLASHRRELSRPQPVGWKRPAEGRVAGTAELERTRDALLDQLAEARANARERAARERRARERRERMLVDPQAHRWEAVSDAEMGEPGCRTYQVAPSGGPLGMLMNWWRLKVSGGCPLPGSA